MTTTSTAPRRPTPTWLTATISGGFGLFYAYMVWNAVAFLVAQASGAFGLNALGWTVLLFAVAMPILSFAAAFALGRRRHSWELALLLLAGLGLVCVFWLNVLAYSYANGSALVGI